MGQYAGATLSQDEFLAFMYNSDNWLYFVQDVLPDVLSGKTKIIGGDYKTVASPGSVMMAVQATGDSYGQVIPDSVIEAAKAPAPAAPVAQAPKTDTAAGQQADLKAELNQWGLGGLYDQAWALKAGGSSDSQIVAWIRTTKEYGQRFAGNVERQAKGLTPLSEAEYLAYEDQARQVMHAAGLPPTFYDQPDDLAKFIGADVSASELNSRVQLGYQVLSQSPPETRMELQRLYNLSDGQMVAALLDPDRALPAIQRQIQAATSAGIARITGYGELSQGQAERVADLSVSEQQARQGFTDLANKQFLLHGFAGEEGISAEQALEAEFGGNANVQQAISRRQAARLAEFKGAGQYASSKKGLVGIGSATSTAS